MLSIKCDGVLESISVSIIYLSTWKFLKDFNSHWSHTSPNTAKLCLYGRKGCVDISGWTSVFHHQGLEAHNGCDMHQRSRCIPWQLTSADLHTVGMYPICFQLSSMYKVKERRSWRECLESATEGTSAWASVLYCLEKSHVSSLLSFS